MAVALLLLARDTESLPRRHQPKLPDGFLPQALAVVAGTLALMGLLVASDIDGLEWLRVIFLALPVSAVMWLARRQDIDSRRLAAVFVLFIAAMIFWAVFEQAGATIALFADTLTRNEIAGVAFPSAWYQSLNPLFVILLAPLFATLWMRLGPVQPSSPAKFALGLLFLAASFLLMVPAAMLAASGKVSPWWLVGLFFLQTVGELLLSPVGLSTMTKLAPVHLVGLVLGIWFLGAAFGNKLAGILAGLFSSSDTAGLAQVFFAQAGVVALAAIALFALAPWLKKLMGGVR
jgi:POT family proton-dependent oligopeptide transporter